MNTITVVDIISITVVQTDMRFIRWDSDWTPYGSEYQCRQDHD